MSKINSLIIFTKHLYYLLKMGAPLAETLQKIIKDIKEPEVRLAVEKLSSKVEKGETLAEGMSKFPNIFPPDYAGMIKASEEAGILPETLKNLARYLEELEVALKNIKIAIFYPTLVLNVLVIYVLFIYLFIFGSLVHTFELFRESLYFEPSLHLKIILFLFKTINSPIFIGIIVALVALLDVAAFSGNTIGSSVLFYLPFTKNILQKAYMTRISRSLGLMLRIGIPIGEALEKVTLAMESEPATEAVKQLKERVLQGKSLSEAMIGLEMFPDIFRWMVKNGEDREDLPGALNQAAEYYEEDLTYFYSRSLRLLEPLLILVVGILVGFLVISFFLTLYQYIGSIY